MVENEWKLIEISKASLQKYIHTPFTEKKRDLMSYEESMPLRSKRKGCYVISIHTPRATAPLRAANDGEKHRQTDLVAFAKTTHANMHTHMHMLRLWLSFQLSVDIITNPS